MKIKKSTLKRIIREELSRSIGRDSFALVPQEYSPDLYDEYEEYDDETGSDCGCGCPSCGGEEILADEDDYDCGKSAFSYEMLASGQEIEEDTY